MNKIVKTGIVILCFLISFTVVFCIGISGRKQNITENSAGTGENHAAQNSDKTSEKNTDVSPAESSKADKPEDKKTSSAQKPEKKNESSTEEKSSDGSSKDEESSEESADENSDESNDEISETAESSAEELSTINVSSDESSTAEESDKNKLPSAPDEFIEHMKAAGLYNYDSNGQIYDSYGQIIVVKSEGTSAHVSMFEKDGRGQWTDCGIDCDGYVGSDGVGSASEYRSASPEGLWGIGDSFYLYSKPETDLKTFELTDDTYWISDVNSKYYNQVTNPDSTYYTGEYEKDWDDNNVEYMSQYSTAYNYGFVIEYNTAARTSGSGSAFFFHCSSGGPTAGCIAVPEDYVLKYLAKLDAGKTPGILIY